MSELILKMFKNDLFIGALISIISITVAWILNTLSRYIENRREEKKQLKRMLFSLLELRNLINKLDVSPTIKYFNEWVVQNLSGQDINAGIKEKTLETLKKLINSSNLTVIQKEIKSIENDFDNGVSKLAEIDPILAYSLSGQTRIINRINEAIETYINNIKDLKKEESLVEDINRIEREVIKSKFLLIRELNNKLKRDLLKVASLIGKKSKNELNKKFESESDELDDDDKDRLNKYLQASLSGMDLS